MCLYVADNMDKLELVYKFSNAQGIKIGPFGRALTPLPMTTSPSTTTTPILTIEITVPSSGVNQLTSVVSTLFVEDTPSSHAPVQRGDEN